MNLEEVVDKLGTALFRQDMYSECELAIGEWSNLMDYYIEKRLDAGTNNIKLDDEFMKGLRDRIISISDLYNLLMVYFDPKETREIIILLLPDNPINIDQQFEIYVMALHGFHSNETIVRRNSKMLISKINKLEMYDEEWVKELYIKPISNLYKLMYTDGTANKESLLSWVEGI